ncbi:MAG: L,D-transpeptidase family protein [Devosia nanyangense]|uniref:L,D-transpeptidase family protein n=1 Tax=Devosia nanyangense TaxID=1228055 RepID=A0A933P003_9HYPH|nr:L,D-transpeptidase family protein [Devosia nanyangense]
MRVLLAVLMAGVCLAGAPAMGLAQDAVVTKAALTRVVIAPPRSDLARIIKAGLQSAYYSADKDSRAYQQAQKLYFFYGERGFEPLWLTNGGDGKVTFSANAERIIEVFKNATLEGFRPSDYLTSDLDPAAAGADPIKLAALETSFSAAAVKYAQDAYGGRIAPTAVSKLLTITPKRINEADMLLKLAASDDPGQLLLDLDPKHHEFELLKAALAKFYADGIKVEQITIPDGPALKLGMKDDRVPTLRDRLAVAAPEIPEGATDAKVDTTYDQALLDAVKAFQESLGLTADGVLGPATVAALNGGSAVSKDDLIANMERWRWEPDDLGPFHVEVNIPEFRAAILSDGKVVHATRVVVGRPTNQTPVFSDEIQNVVVNPYWNVPPSIAVNEIKPHLIANPGYLDSQNMEMLAGGKVINASAIDWTTTNINNYHIRQRPGGGNALGKIKFLFPNEHDVYLHDTPSKSLFARSFRAYSHGCVRVQNPMDFAGALMATNPEITEASLEGMFGDKERWVTLKQHIPVHLMYFTLRVDDDGTIRSYGDVYGHNKKLIGLLNAE